MKRVRRVKNPDRTMPLMGHLKELRNRLLVALIAVVLAAIAGWFVYDPVIVILKSPLDDVAASQGRTAELNFAGIASPFDLKIKVSLFIGVLLAAPVWLYEVCAFVVPGLTRKERFYVFGFLGAALPLFFAGATVAFYALPRAVTTLGSLIPEGASYIVPAQDYLTFCMLLIVVFGIAFVLPVIMVGLNLIDVLSARFIRKSWRWVVVLVAVFAAVATPSPDAISMFYLMVPMLVMFFLAWLVCALNDRRRKRRMIAEGTWVEPEVA